jgi:hypothetical protein
VTGAPARAAGVPLLTATPELWTTQTICNGTPDDVLELLTEPGAIARWSPVPFCVVDAGSERLLAAGALRVAVDRIAQELEPVALAA